MRLPVLFLLLLHSKSFPAENAAQYVFLTTVVQSHTVFWIVFKRSASLSRVEILESIDCLFDCGSNLKSIQSLSLLFILWRVAVFYALIRSFIPFSRPAWFHVFRPFTFSTCRSVLRPPYRERCLQSSFCKGLTEVFQLNGQDDGIKYKVFWSTIHSRPIRWPLHFG